MRSTIGRCLLILLFLGSFMSSAHAQAAKDPLTDTKLIALVAGGALSEDIVHEIESRGLAFRPNDQYQSLINTAGSDALVLVALKNAKIGNPAKRTKTNGADQLLQHLATAGKLMRSKQYREAAAELVGTLQIDTTPEAGFVMGRFYFNRSDGRKRRWC